MIVKSGKSVFDGIAIGRIFLYEKKKQTIYKDTVENIEQELSHFYSAKEQAIGQLKVLYEKALVQTGEDEAMIFDIHQMMLEDEDYNDHILNLIRERRFNAEYAVSVTGEIFADRFAKMDDEYMKERAADIKDISDRLISNLQGGEPALTEISEPVIILARDLSPSETILLDKSKVLSIVTKLGSTNSHTAILARTMNIPAVVNTDIELMEDYNGKMAAVDGFTGRVYINPDEELLGEIRKKQDEAFQQKKMLQELKGKESITQDGRRVQLFANIGGEDDVASVLENDAEGIGLFRTEFLYLGRKDFPGEDEQFEVYKNVITKMGTRKVIIRTLDIGADKQAECFKLEKEENPAMGYRAIRICLDQTDIFKTQLRAIYRAAVYGTVSIMFPMIVSLEEVVKIKCIVEEVKAELRDLNIPHAEPELGIMIETPAAVMLSEELAKEVDFFSIGTNDLTQYTLAADRQNPKLESVYYPQHRAVLKMIQMTVDHAHAAGIWVGICGELAADGSLVETFLKMGVDELSVSPSFILALRKRVREIQ